MEDYELLRSKKEHHGAEPSSTEHDGEGRGTFNLHFLIESCYLFIIFWDSFYHSRILSILIFLKKLFESGLVYITYFFIDSWKKFL